MTQADAAPDTTQSPDAERPQHNAWWLSTRRHRPESRPTQYVFHIVLLLRSIATGRHQHGLFGRMEDLRHLLVHCAVLEALLGDVVERPALALIRSSTADPAARKKTG